MCQPFQIFDSANVSSFSETVFEIDNEQECKAHQDEIKIIYTICKFSKKAARRKRKGRYSHLDREPACLRKKIVYSLEGRSSQTIGFVGLQDLKHKFVKLNPKLKLHGSKIFCAVTNERLNPKPYSEGKMKLRSDLKNIVVKNELESESSHESHSSAADKAPDSDVQQSTPIKKESEEKDVEFQRWLENWVEQNDLSFTS